MRRIRPIFIFSLPRSGSTLLQRSVATHPTISTISEPWVLLPILYFLKDHGVYAEYAHLASHQARQDMLKALPGGESDYLSAMREGVLALYDKASDPSSTHFIDKTPRYHLVCDEIIRMFPEAAFIFLWRNPLSVLASLSETWGGGRWNAFRFRIDLEQGLQNLTRCYEANKGKALALRYEDLVTHPQTTLDGVFEFLGLEPNNAAMHEFSGTKLEGELGDQVGVKNYCFISDEPVSKWKSTVDTAYRVAWCRRYLNRVGARRLSLMGYEIGELHAGLEQVSTRHSKLPIDLAYGFYGLILEKLKKLMLRIGKVQ